MIKKKQENLTNSPGEKQLGKTNSDMTQMSELIDSFIEMIITLLKKVNEKSSHSGCDDRKSLAEEQKGN